MIHSVLICLMLILGTGVVSGAVNKRLPRETSKEDSARYVARLGHKQTCAKCIGNQFIRIGSIHPKSIMESSNELTLGCEVLDRDYADYEQYKDYLPMLGMRKIRLQSGWAKTEKEKGIYDFGWLDKIIDDALSKGIKIWLEVSYGNPIYTGGGTPFLKGGWPSSKEGLEGWDNYVRALASHYKGRVHEWEIWNEPDINKERGNDYESIADLNIRTAEIIKEIDPNAKIAALALALIEDTKLVENCLNEFERRGKLSLFDWISYHQYMYRPEDMYPLVENLRKVVETHAPHIKLWQGESGAPSSGKTGGALSGYDWTEISQAKWALRRILGDLSQEVATGIFSISDINYGSDDGIKKKNNKGLLLADDKNRILRPKRGYYALQNLVAIYDILNNQLDSEKVIVGSNDSCSKYIYEVKEGGLQSILLWWDEAVPFNFNVSIPVDVRIRNGRFKNPVIIDLLSGDVLNLPNKSISKDGNDWIFKCLPVYDSPIVITDRSLIKIDR